MASIVDICNMALQAVGAQAIASLDDANVRAQNCKLYWPTARDAVLEEREWTFATVRAHLQLDGTTPIFGYAKRFALPAAALRCLRCDDGAGDFSVDWRLEGRFVVTDADAMDAILIQRIEDPSTYTPSFAAAVAARLAFHLAIPLTENRGLHQDLWKVYQLQLKAAAALDGTQGKSGGPRSRSIRDRAGRA